MRKVFGTLKSVCRIYTLFMVGSNVMATVKFWCVARQQFHTIRQSIYSLHNKTKALAPFVTAQLALFNHFNESNIWRLKAPGDCHKTTLCEWTNRHRTGRRTDGRTNCIHFSATSVCDTRLAKYPDKVSLPSWTKRLAYAYKPNPQF